jgi:hypothetical protein
VRNILIATCAILLLGILAVIGISAVSKAPRLSGGASTDVAAITPPSPTTSPLPAPGLKFDPRPDPPPPPLIQGPPRAEPPKDTWEAVEPTARASELGPVGAAVGRELNELHNRIAACFDEDVQARHGLQPITAVKDFASVEDNGTTILMLEIETSQGQVRIVDAPVETRGSASDGLIACAQRVLRGHTVVAPTAVLGSRHRLMYTLMP